MYIINTCWYYHFSFFILPIAILVECYDCDFMQYARLNDYDSIVYNLNSIGLYCIEKINKHYSKDLKVYEIRYKNNVISINLNELRLL